MWLSLTSTSGFSFFGLLNATRVTGMYCATIFLKYVQFCLFCGWVGLILKQRLLRNADY